MEQLWRDSSGSSNLILIVSYCKHGYFRWGKISQKCWQDISRGGIFHETTTISFIKAYGFYFRVGVIFPEEDRSAKNAKITPTRKFPRLQYCFTQYLWKAWWHQYFNILYLVITIWTLQYYLNHAKLSIYNIILFTHSQTTNTCT